MLTSSEIVFLQSQGLTADDVYDARGQSMATWKARARAAGKVVVLGTPCASGGHRLRSRSGHCVQCDTRKLAYQNRHHSPGFVYIAGSPSTLLLKIGTATDIDQRERNLRNQAYGNLRDWQMLFWAKVSNGGKTEGEAQRRLERFRVGRAYDKDGTPQEAGELFRTTFTEALKAMTLALSESKHDGAWRSPQWTQFDSDTRRKPKPGG